MENAIHCVIILDLLVIRKNRIAICLSSTLYTTQVVTAIFDMELQVPVSRETISISTRSEKLESKYCVQRGRATGLVHIRAI